MVLLGYGEREAWRKTPYQIVALFRYHREYNPHIFKQERAAVPGTTEEQDDIDIALGVSRGRGTYVRCTKGGAHPV